MPEDAPEQIKYISVKVALQSVHVQGKRKESNVYEDSCFYRVCFRELSLIYVILGE